MRAQIDEFKRFYHLLQDGDYARLTNPFRDQEFTAWQHTAPDRSEALVSVVAGMARSNAPFRTVYPRGLDPDMAYQVDGWGCFRGDTLMYGGIPLPQGGGDYQSWQFHLKKV